MYLEVKKLKVKANSQILVITPSSGRKLFLYPSSVSLENLFSSSVERVSSAKSTTGFVIGFVKGSIAISSNSFLGFCHVFGFAVEIYCLSPYLNNVGLCSAWLVTR